jgi:hypothetical protein
VRGERVLKQTSARLSMENSYLIETLRETAAVNGLQIATLIGNLSRSVDMLTADIEHEETQAGIRDLSDPTYPVLAWSLGVRRDNIVATVAMLQNIRAPKKGSARDTMEHEVA